MRIDEPKTKTKVSRYLEAYNAGKAKTEQIRGSVVGTLDRLVQWFCDYTITYKIEAKPFPISPERGTFWLIPISSGMIDAKSLAKRFNLSDESGHRTIRTHLDKLSSAGVIAYIRSERKAHKGQITKDYSLTIGINASLIEMRE